MAPTTFPLLFLPVLLTVAHGVPPIKLPPPINNMQATGMGLQYCTLPKSGSTITKIVLCELELAYRRKPQRMMSGKNMSGNTVCTNNKWFLKSQVRRWNPRQPGVKFTLFRHPVDRVISVYGDMCGRKHFCKQMSINQFVKNLYFLYRGRNNFPGHKAVHLRYHAMPQAAFCNLKGQAKNFAIVKYNSDKARMKRQLHRIFVMAKVPPHLSQRALRHITQSSTEHANKNHARKSDLKEKVLNNPQTMKYLQAIYHDDFRIWRTLK
ncbi:unnamed protein product, partial [Mesorhabditis spiculigera]